MSDSAAWLILLLGFAGVLCLPLVGNPRVRRRVAPLAGRVQDWVVERSERRVVDPEEHQLRLVGHRQRLCADLARVERLLATDAWMSATRQIANRIAYHRLVEDLRRVPEVVPAYAVPEWSGEPTGAGFVAQAPKVEVLEIGWRRRRDAA